MPEPCQSRPPPLDEIAKVRLARLAKRQWGVVSSTQLAGLGLSRTTTANWIAVGYLHCVHPRVYAVGHPAVAVEGRLVAALLYSGPGAMLSHGTAAWWWRLTDREPAVVHVSATGRHRSPPGVLVHGRRPPDRVVHRGLPITSVARTLLELAATARLAVVRQALAEADYRRLIDPRALEAALGRGHPGSALLREAFEHHRPELALTRSELEREFLALCERSSITVPEVNCTLDGMMVDALWRDERLVVELDGKEAHSTPHQLARDRDRELRLRSAGYTVHRYSWKQVTRQPKLLLDDLHAALTGR